MISLGDKTDQGKDHIDLRNEALEQLHSSIELIDLIKLNLSIMRAKGSVKSSDFDMFNEELGRISVSISQTEKTLIGSVGEVRVSEKASRIEIIGGSDGPSIGRRAIRSTNDRAKRPEKVPPNLSHITKCCNNDIIAEEHQIRPSIATFHRKAYHSKRSFFDHEDSGTIVRCDAIGGYESGLIDYSDKVKKGARGDHSTAFDISDHGEQIIPGIPMKNPISLAECKLPLSNNILASLKKMGLEFI